MTGPRPEPRSLALVLVIGAAVVVAALGHAAAFWPGIMVWDAIRQYGQALSGQYDDWHPPAMNWLWRQFVPLLAGPGPMLLLQVALYWSGLGLLARAAWRRGWVAAAAVLLCGLMPVALVLVGTVLKDSPMAGCLLVAAGLVAHRPRGWLAGAGIALLLVAASALRFNAAVAVVPLALAALPSGATATRGRSLVAGALIGAALLAVIPAGNHLLHARRSGVEQSLMIYDLGGITRFSGTDAFPPLPAVRDPVAVSAACYTPVSWDRYAWWGPEPCAIGFAGVRAAWKAHGADPRGWWLRAVAAHPLAYAEHRLAHFACNLRWCARELPGLSLQSDPNPWGFTVSPNRARDALGRWGQWWEGAPVGRPGWWLVLGAIAFALTIGAPRGGMARPLLGSALLYGASFLPLSVASEVRYHLWTMLAVALGTVFALAERFAARR